MTEPKKVTDETEALHKTAREVQETLKRLLKEINEILDRTKKSPEDNGTA